MLRSVRSLRLHSQVGWRQDRFLNVIKNLVGPIFILLDSIRSSFMTVESECAANAEVTAMTSYSAEPDNAK
jgi:hypothetical protein